MERSVLHIIVEVECICCGRNDVKHQIVGVYEDYNKAIEMRDALAAYRAKMGLVFPHTQIVLFEVPTEDGLIGAYPAIIEQLPKKRKSRKSVESEA